MVRDHAHSGLGAAGGTWRRGEARYLGGAASKWRTRSGRVLGGADGRRLMTGGAGEG